MDQRASYWSRRRFLAGAAAGVGVLAGCAHGAWQPETAQPGKPHRVGYLATDGVPPEPLLQELERLGYAEHENLAFEPRLLKYRSTYLNDSSRLSDLAAALVRLQPDVLVTPTLLATRAARSRTSTIPIVMRVASDPITAGLVASLVKPGGNVTGLAGDQSGQVLAKRIELLKAIVPGLTRLATFVPVGSEIGVTTVRGAESTAAAAGVELRALPLRGPDDLEGSEELRAVLAGPEGVPPHGLILLPMPGSRRMEELALRSGLPTMGRSRRFVAAGGLMSYGPSESERVRRLAAYVDQILKGARPADLPVEEPAAFDFVVNLATAHRLGITLPDVVLQQATEVLS